MHVIEAILHAIGVSGGNHRGPKAPAGRSRKRVFAYINPFHNI